MKRRRRPSDYLTDAELLCFVRWCRMNHESLTERADVARRVLDAYAGSGPAPAEPEPEPIDA